MCKQLKWEQRHKKTHSVYFGLLQLFGEIDWSISKFPRFVRAKLLNVCHWHIEHISEFHARTLHERGPVQELTEALQWMEMVTLAEWCQSAVPEVFLCWKSSTWRPVEFRSFFLMCLNYKEHYYVRMMRTSALAELWWKPCGLIIAGETCWFIREWSRSLSIFFFWDISGNCLTFSENLCGRLRLLQC